MIFIIVELQKMFMPGILLSLQQYELTILGLQPKKTAAVINLGLEFQYLNVTDTRKINKIYNV